jgi:hypothetical protein
VIQDDLRKIARSEELGETMADGRLEMINEHLTAVKAMDLRGYDETLFS